MRNTRPNRFERDAAECRAPQRNVPKGPDRCGEGVTAAVHHAKLRITHDVQYSVQGQVGPFRGEEGGGVKELMKDVFVGNSDVQVTS